MIRVATVAQINLLKVLACMAWADGEVSNAELNFIKRLARQMDLSADEWLQLDMYMDEKVREEEALRMTRRFLTQIHGPGQRRKLTESVSQLLRSDEVLSTKEREWLDDFERAVAETSQASFLVDGLRSFLRIGAGSHHPPPGGREAEFHDFIHNRVLFRLRRRVGSQQLERVGRPEKLKKITLSAAFLAQVGYVKDDLDPQEVEVIQKVLRAMWDVSEPMAHAITGVATESASKGLDLYRVMEETKATMSLPERKSLLQGLFAVAKAEGKTSSEEIEEIRKIAYGLGFSHREFINAKLKAMGKD
jgi:uncharacterized tellurite resistance protein B-like protein